MALRFDQDPDTTLCATRERHQSMGPWSEPVSLGPGVSMRQRVCAECEVRQEQTKGLEHAAWRPEYPD